MLESFGLSPLDAVEHVLDPEAAAVLEQVRQAASDADELARATGLGAGELAGILTMLELAGARERRGGSRACGGSLASPHGRFLLARRGRRAAAAPTVGRRARSGDRRRRSHGLLVRARAGAGGRARPPHEARTIAGGASGRNGGFALRGGAMPYDEARATLGLDRAKAFWELTERGLQQIRALAGDAYRQTGSLRLAADEAERAELEIEFRALEEDGFAVEWLDRLPPQLARFAGGIRHLPDGAIQPARWVRRLAQHGGRGRSRDPRALAGRVARRAEGAERRDRDRRLYDGLVAELDAVDRPCPQPGRRHRAARGAARSRIRTTRGSGFDYWQQTPDRRLVAGGRRGADETENTSEEALTQVIQERARGVARRAASARCPRSRTGGPGSSARALTCCPLAGAVPGGAGALGRGRLHRTRQRARIRVRSSSSRLRSSAKRPLSSSFSIPLAFSTRARSHELQLVGSSERSLRDRKILDRETGRVEDCDLAVRTCGPPQSRAARRRAPSRPHVRGRRRRRRRRARHRGWPAPTRRRRRGPGRALRSRSRLCRGRRRPSG